MGHFGANAFLNFLLVKLVDAGDNFTLPATSPINSDLFVSVDVDRVLLCAMLTDDALLMAVSLVPILLLLLHEVLSSTETELLKMLHRIIDSDTDPVIGFTAADPLSVD